MGQLTNMMNADFDRRIEIAKKLGIFVHSKEMLDLLKAEKANNITMRESQVLKQMKCPHCDKPIGIKYLVCPRCHKKIPKDYLHRV